MERISNSRFASCRLHINCQKRLTAASAGNDENKSENRTPTGQCIKAKAESV